MTPHTLNTSMTASVKAGHICLGIRVRPFKISYITLLFIVWDVFGEIAFDAVGNSQGHCDRILHKLI